MSPKRSGDVSNPASNASSATSPPATVGAAASSGNDNASSPGPGVSSSSIVGLNGSNTPQTAGKKRRASASGSRGVANLTPEQLAKKRANDREAQRAIRERTKNTIESLERRIQELTSQQPYQELQQAIQQKELVEAENADIKRRLSAVLGLLQPLLAGSNFSDGNSTYDSRTAYRPPIHSALTRDDHLPQPYSPSSGSMSSAHAIGRTHTGQWHSPATSATHSQGSPLASNAADVSQRGRRHDRAADGGMVPGLLRTTSTERQTLGLLPVGRPEIQAGEHAEDGRRPLSHLPADSHITLASSRSPEAQPYGGNRIQQSTYSSIPPHTTPSCPLDGLLLDFLAERHRMAVNGASEDELVGPRYPDFYAMMYPDKRQLSPGISKMFTDILSTFPDIAEAPEKIAVYLVMFLVMRWHVCPTRENYERLPKWIRPTSWQMLTPHPIWIDHLPWPEMREELVRNFHRYPFENFFVPYTKTFSINWQYDPRNIFLPAKPESAELVLDPAFESHVLDLKNWSLGTQFSQTFPLLSTHVRIVDHDKKAR